MSEAVWPDLAGRIEAGKHILPIRVYYEDTDFSGVVYHANFLKFIERGRSDYLRLLGVGHRVLAGLDRACAFAVKSMALEYLKPARIDDLLEVRTCFGKASPVRFELVQEIFRDQELLFEAGVVIAVINDKGQPVRLDRAVFERMVPL